MAHPRPEVSIVVPVYGSEKILPHLVEQVEASMQRADVAGRYELILVNDASPDDSWNVIGDLAARYPFVRGVCLMRNFGQHNATMAGLNRARGEVVVIMDDDLQHPPQTILQLVDAVRGGYDVCYTDYVGRRHAVWKKFGSWINDRFASFLLKKPRGLYLSSYKALHRRVVRAIVRYEGPYAYLDGLILDVTRRITSVPIPHQPRMEGKGNYNLRRSLSLWLKMATSFSVMPLRAASLAGALLAVIAALSLIAVILDKLRHPDTPAGWTSLVAVMLLLGGLQLLFLGVIGEYLGRAYLKLNRKPQFVVRELTGDDEADPRDAD
jgi:undecaprenyl-phosphate 4-deoxy-4-formamido-L-arabinose transferase